MEHSLLPSGIHNLPFLYRAQGNDIDSLSIEGDKVKISVGKEPIDLRLPELETLMLENDRLFNWFSTNVHDNNIKSVDENSLIRNNNFFQPVLFWPENVDIGISNVQFVFVLDEKPIL